MTRAWPGFDMNGMTLAELRRRIRGKGAGDLPAPPGRQPEHISIILERMGFVKRGQDDGRHE